HCNCKTIGLHGPGLGRFLPVVRVQCAFFRPARRCCRRSRNPVMHLHSPTAHSDPGTAAPAPWPRLVADIGGTNVRFALIAHPGAAPSALRSLRCADFAGPGEALRAWLADTGASLPTVAAF